MVFMENTLDSKLNPLTALGRSGQALTGFVNKFNGEPELLDDLVSRFSETASVMLRLSPRTTIGQRQPTRYGRMDISPPTLIDHGYYISRKSEIGLFNNFRAFQR